MTPRHPSRVRLLAAWFSLLTVGAGLGSAQVATAESSSYLEGGKRGKTIDFEDEVVEGLNKKPLDSLNQISERDRRKHKPHLYLKRAGFRPETAESLHTMRYMQ